jgi:hypothetical protein
MTMQSMKFLFLFFIIMFVNLIDVKAQVFKSLEMNVLSFGYCGETNKIYAGVMNGNLEDYELNVIDASTGLTYTTMELGHKPLDIEISNNCEYMYISYADSPLIQRFELSTLTLDISINLPIYGGDPLFANDIKIFNANPAAIAFVLNDFTIVGSEVGISTYLNDIEKDFLIISNITEIELSDNDSILFGYNSNSSSNDISVIDLIDYSFSNNTLYPNIVDASSFSTHMERIEDKLYFSDGTIINVNQDSIWLDPNTFPVSGVFNFITKNESNSRIITIENNLFFNQRILSVDVSNPLVADTINFSNNLELEPDLVTSEIKSTNCNKGFIVSTRNVNVQFPGEIGRLIIYNPNIMNFEEVICEGDSILFNNQYYSETGTHVDTSNYIENSCDILEQLNLYIIPTESYITVTYCEEYDVIIEGQEINESGTYTFYSANQLGCDSINIYTVEILEMEEFVIDTFGSFGEELFGITLISDTTLIFEISPQFGCDYTWIINIDLLTSINGTVSNSFKIFPNPVKEYVTIYTSTPSYNIKIYSIKGELIKNIKGNERNSLIDVSYLPSGIYFFQITSNESSYIEKIIKT